MNLNDELKSVLLEQGASLVGFADISDVDYNIRQGYDYAIIIGIALNKEIVKGIKNGPTMEYYEEYSRVNNKLNEIDKFCENYLIGKGYDALGRVSSSIPWQSPELRTPLPHKTIATKSGIGWIGKCALLITEEFGSALRISSILTNAKVNTGNPIEESKCGNCNICAEVCPGDAVLGKNWNKNMKREEFYNANACEETAISYSHKAGIDDSICGICIANCPYTLRYLNI